MVRVISVFVLFDLIGKHFSNYRYR